MPSCGRPGWIRLFSEKISLAFSLAFAIPIFDSASLSHFGLLIFRALQNRLNQLEIEKNRVTIEVTRFFILVPVVGLEPDMKCL